MESGGVYVVIQSPQRVEKGAVLVPQVGHLFAPEETHRLDRLERSLLSYNGSYGHISTTLFALLFQNSRLLGSR